MRSSTHALLPIAFALLVLPAATEGQDELPPAARRTVAFDREIRPILAARCLGCHDADRRKGGFRLDRRESLLTGGDSGPVVEVGKSAESLLIEKVAGLDPVSTMPPKGDPLTPEQVGLLRAWIDQGARWEGGPLVAESASGASEHWAFRKPVRPALPDVENRALVAQPDRSLHPREAGAGRAFAIARSGPGDPDPPPLAGPDRPAAITCRRSTPSSPMTAPTPTSGWSIACSTPPTTANAGPVAGSTWPATPTPTATRRTAPARSGPIATGSSRPSTPTCPSTGSPSSSWPATCSRIRRSPSESPPASTATR